MGGGGHHEPYTVPPASTHNYKECPELVEYEQRLKRLGLKDPWIRNYWPIFNPRFPDHVKVGKHQIFWLVWTFFKPGLLPGAVCAGSVIAIEELYSKFRYGHTSWGGHWAEPHHHDEHHGEGGHEGGGSHH